MRASEEFQAKKAERVEAHAKEYENLSHSTRATPEEFRLKKALLLATLNDELKRISGNSGKRSFFSKENASSATQKFIGDLRTKILTSGSTKEAVDSINACKQTLLSGLSEDGRQLDKACGQCLTRCLCIAEGIEAPAAKVTASCKC